jgi:dihydrofolate reductase
MSAPRLSLIAALDENGLIGREGGLPWRLPDDLAHFKRLTLGKIVLMGRRTWDSLGRPLPQRRNWVLSRAAEFRPEGASVFHGLEPALQAAAGEELMVIGGAELYRIALPLAQRLYLTRVHARLHGDTHFPAFEAEQFAETARAHHAADERHAHAFSFLTLERRRGSV